jgi:antitoxin ParD1/3/4
MINSYHGGVNVTTKVTISLTDQAHELARSLVERGDFASLSAVVQHGLRLVQREEEEQEARLDAIRADLDRRAAQPSISLEEGDALLAAWRREREAQRGRGKRRNPAWEDVDDLA